MATTEVWVTSILSIVLSIITAYIIIAYILPVVRALVKEIFDNSPAINGFIYLLVIVVYILLLKKIVEILSEIPAEEGAKSIGSYLSVLNPGISILDQLIPLIGWILLGTLIAFGLGRYLKK